ncbi:MAG TPA: thiamine phosphate synthase [Acidobacteriaceae bacterium]
MAFMGMLARFYPILDADLLARRKISIADCAKAMCDAGVMLLQYRDKQAMPQEILRNAEIIKTIFEGTGCVLILDDRADVAAIAGWDGVHVGQQDLSPDAARLVMGPDAIIGLSTHNGTQVLEGDAAMERIGGSGYLAIGPVFATGSKENPDPVVGLEGVRRARTILNQSQTPMRLPLVAIGGITLESAADVVAAGADAIAVISGAIGRDATETAARCREWMTALKA